jgi:hypothetical protein
LAVFYRSFHRVLDRGATEGKETTMKGHVARKRALLRGHLGRPRLRHRQERRSWHAAGTDRAEAEALAARLAAERDGRTLHLDLGYDRQ